MTKILKFKKVKPRKKKEDELNSDPFRFITKEDLLQGIKNKKENEQRS